jgi:uncharacterized protein YrrD
VIVNAEMLPAREKWVSVSEQIKGRDVISADGARVGQLNDVVIDLKGQLVSYNLAQVSIEGPLAESRQIAVKATHSLGQDVLIIDMAKAVVDIDAVESVGTDAVEAASLPEMDEGLPRMNKDE